MATSCSGPTALETLVCIWMLISNLQNISLKIVHTGHGRAAIVLKCFHTRNPEVLVKAFCTYVRPILEYCTPVWSPHHIGHVDKIEKSNIALQREFFVYLIYRIEIVYYR